MKLKIISLNLWLGGVLMDEIVEFLRSEDPDIILLQEVYDGDESLLKPQYKSLSILKQKLDLLHFHFAPAFEENLSEIGKINQGNAVFSRFPIINQSIKFYDVPFGERVDDPEHYHVTPRNLQHIEVELEDKKLHVLNTQGIWGKHGNDTYRRLKMADVIATEVRDKHPLVLGGDFNVNPKTKTVEKIKNELKSVFGDELATSFNLSRKDLNKDPGYRTSAVDMIFVSRDVKILSKKCPNIDISDHLPLVVEVEV